MGKVAQVKIDAWAHAEIVLKLEMKWSTVLFGLIFWFFSGGL